MEAEQLNAIVEAVVSNYLTSGDFKGLRWNELNTDLQGSDAEIRGHLKSLIQSRRITFRTDDIDVNPAIKRLPDLGPEREAELAGRVRISHLYLFPTVDEMRLRPRIIDPKVKPFTSLLEQGYAQLDHRCFHLDVLEHYRSDPRYSYEASDIEGRIHVKDESTTLSDTDQIFMQTFGFAYDDDFNRAVAAYIRYLSDLSEEHQRIWAARQIPQGTFKPHPDYYRMSIVGGWGTHIPILSAFCLELFHINKICERMGRPPLFNRSFKNERPTNFTFLIRPTTREFDQFVHLLDKMLSDNINKDFFRGSIPLEEEIIRSDAKIVVRPIGTIRLLENWLEKSVKTPDSKPLNEAIAAFKEVRRLRQKPAHAIEDNQFDLSLIKEQRELIIRVYKAVRTLRLLFQNHPTANDYEIPESALVEGRIRDF
jgi:hypothetical protein